MQRGRGLRRNHGNDVSNPNERGITLGRKIDE